MAETLATLVDKVDQVLVLDGYFKMENTPHKHPARSKTGESTDGSQELVPLYNNQKETRNWIRWVRPDREYHGQIDKLNRIPELVPDNEWVFIIDTDEILVSHIKDGLRVLAGWFSQWCDVVPIKIEEPYYQHPFTGFHGRNRFYARLMKVKKGMRWTTEGTVIYPEGRITLYCGTFPQTVYIRHLRREH